MTLLQVEGLTVALPAGGDRAEAVSDVSFALAPGEILCLVGESGSGKSVSAAAVMGLLPPTLRPVAGAIRFEGQDLLRAGPEAVRALRGARIGMVFQEPMSALNPLMRVGEQIGEVLRTHPRSARRLGAAQGRILALLESVHLPEPAAIARAWPHRLSGGQRQRVMIAMAMALEPALLIADEPTTALDVTTQAQILRLVRELQARRGTAVLFITHDFGVVADIADRVAVMRHGRVVEQGAADAILERPAHAYTRTLIDAALHEGGARASTVRDGAPLLAVERLRKSYRRGGTVLRAVDEACLALRRGETLGVVGESGSGKSTLARSIVRLVRPEGGAIRLDGTDLLPLSRRGWAPYRRRVQMVFQDPYASLNPRRRVGEAIAAGPIALGMARAEALARAREWLALVQLGADAAERFPHEFSGGQRQRIGIARALALEPELLVADEPVSALDVSVQAQVLALLDALRLRLGLTMLFITHDLRVAARICDRVVVMQRGRIVEEGETARVFGAPAHAYTRALLESVPGAAWRQRAQSLPA